MTTVVGDRKSSEEYFVSVCFHTDAMFPVANLL